MPTIVPPLNVKVSVLALPTRFSILEKPPVPVTFPPFNESISHVFATLSAVKVSLPPAPLTVPTIVPPVNVKVSVLVLPTRFSILENPPVPVTSPPFNESISHVFATLLAVKVSVPLPPSSTAATIAEILNASEPSRPFTAMAPPVSDVPVLNLNVFEVLSPFMVILPFVPTTPVPDFAPPTALMAAFCIY